MDLSAITAIDWSTVFDYLAVIVGVVTGSLFAVARKLDIVGTIAIGLITAYGGGIIRDTLLKTAALSPDSVTVHSLAVKRSSRLNLEKDMYAAYRMENTDAMMDFAGKTLKAEGLLPYYLYRQKNMAGNQENVGYARPGKEGVYNVLIMEECESIVALGAGASSKKVDPSTGLITRVRNPHDVATYISDPEEMKRRKLKLFGLS